MMTVHIEAPVTYQHWTGRTADVADAALLRATWPWPRYIDAGWVTPDMAVTVPDVHETRWVHLGWTPKPRSRWERFWAHWHHGRLMRYPLLSVLVFCVRGLAFPRPRWWT